MKALILCAGFGTRLKPLTNKINKCMLEIAGRPILEHLMFHLYKFGISEIIVNTHYRPETIYNYFGPRLLYSYEPELLGEEGTIESLKQWFFRDYTAIMNGDTLTDLDINEMFRWSNGQNIKAMDGRIYTGTKIIGPQYFMGNKGFFDYFPADLKWIDIGTPENLEKAKQEYEKENKSLNRLS